MLVRLGHVRLAQNNKLVSSDGNFKLYRYLYKNSLFLDEMLPTSYFKKLFTFHFGYNCTVEYIYTPFCSGHKNRSNKSGERKRMLT